MAYVPQNSNRESHPLDVVSSSSSKEKRGHLEQLTKKMLNIPFWKRRECILKSGNFYIVNEKNTRPINLKYAKVSEDFGLNKQFCFHIALNDGSVYLFAASSRTEVDEWVKAITEAINEQTDRGNKHKTELILDDLGTIIPEDQLQITDVNLGKGGMGVVKKGLWLNSVEVAVKSINNIPEFIDQWETDTFFKEIELLSKLRHPNIVQLYGYCKKSGVMLLVTQFVPGGNLEQAIHNKSNTLLNNSALQIEIAANIVKGMIYLHSKKVIHRDMKSANILVEKIDDPYNVSVKVCDFGVAKILDNQKTGTVNAFGTPAYQAPELALASHNHKVDVYSFAVLLWEISTRTLPWSHLASSVEIITRVINGERLKISDNNIFAEIITKSWNPTPNLRPEFSDILIMLNDLKKKHSYVPSTPSPSPSPSVVRKDNQGFVQGIVSHNSETKQLLNTRGSLIMSADLMPSQQKPLSPNIYRDVSPSTPTPVPPTEYKLQTASFEHLLMGIFDKKGPIISWDDFGIHMNNVMDANVAYKFQYLVLASEETVSRENVQKLVSWMSVLKPKSEKTKRSLWRSLLDVIEAQYFHGWMNPNQAKVALTNVVEGIFLLRFSSKPGSFALSVAHAKDVYHCRIDCNLTSRGGIYFDQQNYNEPEEEEVISYQIHNKQYNSITDIIQTHMKVPLGVIESSDAVLLHDPVMRRTNMYCLVPNS